MSAPTTPINEERDAIETAAQEGLRNYTRAHRGHDGVDSPKFQNYGGRQSASCGRCLTMFVGPAYVWLNRGVTLTAAGKAIRDIGEAAEPLDKAVRLGWEAADKGSPRVPSLDAEHRAQFEGVPVGRYAVKLGDAWLKGWDARMLPEQTVIGERALGCPA